MMKRCYTRLTVGVILLGGLITGAGCYNKSLCDLVNDPLWGCGSEGGEARLLPSLGDDLDGDGALDVRDNCPDVVNPDQADADGDDTGDACDACPGEPSRTAPDEAGAELTCGDAVDNDCDGLTDGDDPDCSPPAVCPYACGDMNGDLDVNLNDFSAFIPCYDETVTLHPECVCMDMNGDDVVNLADFLLLTQLFGVGSTNSPPNCEGAVQ